MRMKLSKSQWEIIGLSTGWIKKAYTEPKMLNEIPQSVVGYWWHSERHTIEETKQAIEDGTITIKGKVSALDSNGLPEIGMRDRDGMPVFCILKEN